MDIEIKEIKDNPALHRKEISFVIRHLGQGSPNRLEVKDKLAALQTADPKLTFIVKLQTVFGIPEVQGKARIYEDAEVANRVERKYIHIRNMPKEARADAWKEAKGK
jgi:ribosomal protein S24E